MYLKVEELTIYHGDGIIIYLFILIIYVGAYYFHFLRGNYHIPNWNINKRKHVMNDKFDWNCMFAVPRPWM